MNSNQQYTFRPKQNFNTLADTTSFNYNTRTKQQDDIELSNHQEPQFQVLHNEQIIQPQMVNFNMNFVQQPNQSLPQFNSLSSVLHQSTISQPGGEIHRKNDRESQFKQTIKNIKEGVYGFYKNESYKPYTINKYFDLLPFKMSGIRVQSTVNGFHQDWLRRAILSQIQIRNPQICLEELENHYYIKQLKELSNIFGYKQIAYLAILNLFLINLVYLFIQYNMDSQISNEQSYQNNINITYISILIQMISISVQNCSYLLANCVIKKYIFVFISVLNGVEQIDMILGLIYWMQIQNYGQFSINGWIISSFILGMIRSAVSLFWNIVIYQRIKRIEYILGVEKVENFF